jgi:hypothetical protein
MQRSVSSTVMKLLGVVITSIVGSDFQFGELPLPCGNPRTFHVHASRNERLGMLRVYIGKETDSVANSWCCGTPGTGNLVRLWLFFLLTLLLYSLVLVSC